MDDFEFRTVRVERIGVSGHQDLPEAAVEHLRRSLDRLVLEPRAVEIVCSLAVGADTLVAELMISRGSSIRAIVPSQGYESTFDDDALTTYRTLLSRARAIETLSFDKPSETAFLEAGRRVVEQSDWLLAVWDGKPARGAGGTADIVQHAQRLGRRVEIVWPPGLER